MRVGVTSEWIGENVGGLERYATRLLRNLVDVDAKNEYAFFVTPRGADRIHSLVGERVAVRRTAFNSRWYFIPLGVPLEVLRYPVDLLHATFTVAPWCPAKRLVLTVQDVCPEVYPEFFPPAVRYRFRWLVSRGVARAHRIVVPTEATKRELTEYYRVDGDKISVVPLGVDSVLGRNGSVAPEDEAETTFDLPSEFILYVGRFHARKNLEGLLQAFSVLKARNCSGVRLVLAGRDLWNWERVMRRIHELRLEGDVVCPGHVSEEVLGLLYRRASVFAFPSLHEGFGVPPLEAMAHGLPVVASNRSAMPEVLGDAAILVDPEDPEALATALEKLLQDGGLRQEFVRRGKERVKRYSWSTMARATVGLYEATMAESH